MDYGKNLKYFKSSDTLFYIGIPIFILGGILFALSFLWFYFLPYQEIIGLILAAIGAALAFLPRSIRTSEKELDAIITSRTEGYTNEVIERLHLEKHILKTIPPVSIGNYIYDETNLLMRRGKDDRKCRTSKYSAAAVLCMKNGIVCSQKTFSLIEECVTEEIYEFPYSDLDCVSVFDEETYLADETRVKHSFLNITKNDGTVCKFPTIHIIAVDRLAEEINLLIKQAKT